MGALNIVAVVMASFRSLFEHPRLLVGVALPIYLGSVLLQTVVVLDRSQHPYVYWLLVIPISFYVQLVLVLTWQRAVLLSRRDIEWVFRPTHRLLRYFRYTVGYGILVVLVVLVLAVVTVLANLAFKYDPIRFLADHPGAKFALSVPGIFLLSLAIARLGFVFPAVAVDRETSIETSWDETDGIGWSLGISIFLIQVPFIAVSWALDGVRELPLDGAVQAILLIVGSLIEGIGALALISSLSLVYAWRHNLRADTTQT